MGEGGAEVQPNEVVNLAISVLLAPMFYLAVTRADLPDRSWLLAGYAVLLVAFVATIAEGFLLPESLNFVEHLCYTVAAGLFLRFVIGVRRMGGGRASA